MNEKLFREIDEISRKLDGLSHHVADIAYRASGKRAPEPVESVPSASRNRPSSKLLCPYCEDILGHYWMHPDIPGRYLCGNQKCGSIWEAK